MCGHISRCKLRDVNYHHARERRGKNGEGTSRWCFTTKNDGQCWVNPSCAEHYERDHDSPLDASCCFYEYELAKDVTEYEATSGYLECIVCGGPSKRNYRIGHYLFSDSITIYEKHNTAPDAVRVIVREQRPVSAENFGSVMRPAGIR
jgi:hypothetical protein